MLFLFSITSFNKKNKIIIKKRIDYSLEKLIKIRPYYFFDNSINMLKKISIFKYLFGYNKYYPKYSLIFKNRNILNCLKKKKNIFFKEKWSQIFIENFSLKNKKRFYKKNSNWIIAKFFYWLLNYYKFFMILLLKIYGNLWIFFIYSFHNLNIQFFLKQYDFLYSLKKFKYKQNTFFQFKFFYIYNYLCINDYYKCDCNFIINILNINNFNLNIRLDSLKYWPKYLNPFNFNNRHKKIIWRSRTKKYVKSRQYFSKKKNMWYWNYQKNYKYSSKRKNMRYWNYQKKSEKNYKHFLKIRSRNSKYKNRNKHIINYIKKYPTPKVIKSFAIIDNFYKPKKLYNITKNSFTYF